MARRKKPELLMPAGSLEGLKTAVIFGADAVYIGGEAFGLRAKAKNFSPEEMARGTGGFAGTGRLLVGTMAAVLAVFVCGVLADMARKRIFGGLHRILLRAGFYRRLTEKIERADALFREA